MNELRWILLVAGIALIAGMYFWGTRSRRRSAAPGDRPIRFDTRSAAPTAGTSGASRVEPRVSMEPEYEPLPDEGTGATVLIEELDTTRPPPPMPPRREPTLGARVEHAPARPAPTPEPAEGYEPTVRISRPQAAPPQAASSATSPGTAEKAPQKSQQKIVAIRVNAPPPARLEGARLQEALVAEGLEFGRYQIFHRLHADGRPIFSLASLREPGTFDPATMANAAYPGVALFAVLPGPVSGAEAFDQLVYTARALAAQLGATLADDRGAPLTVHRIGRMREEILEFERALAASGAA